MPYSLIELATLQSDGVVPSQLVGSVYPTHVPVVEGNTLRARDISHRAIPSLSPDSSGGRGGCVACHDVDKLGVTPDCEGDVARLPESVLSPLQVSCVI